MGFHGARFDSSAIQKSSLMGKQALWHALDQAQHMLSICAKGVEHFIT